VGQKILEPNKLCLESKKLENKENVDFGEKEEARHRPPQREMKS